VSLRVAPLHIGVPRTLERSPRCAETFDLSEKLSAFLSGKRDEGRPRIDQARAIVVGQERP
jgi:hypothetical protein